MESEDDKKKKSETDKKKKNNEKKEEDEVDEKLKSEEKETEKKQEKKLNAENVEKLNDIHVILDIIGGIKYAVAEQSIKTSEFTNDNVLKLSNYCELNLELTDDVPFNYIVFNDVGNENVYVLNEPLYKASFDSCDSFVENRLSVREEIILDAKKILREPPVECIAGNLGYKPNSVGIDYDNLFAFRINENEVNVVSGFCRKIGKNGCFADVRTIGDKRIAQLRTRIMSYSEDQMNILLTAVRQYTRICSGYCDEPMMVIKELTVWQRPMPLCNPFIRAGVFDNFIRAPQLRYEYIVSVFSPDLKLSPATYANLMRTAMVAMTKASFANDFIQLSYQPIWGQPISWYVSSWLSIGDLILNFDNSDVDRIDQEVKNVIVSLIFLASITYDAHGIYSNTNLTSIKQACKCIFDWARSVGLITRPRAQDNPDDLLTPLSNCNVERGVKLTDRDLQRIGGMHGVAGASVDADLPFRANDPLRDLFPGISMRRNVAVDVDDYVVFTRDNANYFWPLEESINKFVRCHNDLKPFSALISLFLTRQKSFYVRLNEYMRIAHYNIFRRSETSRLNFQNDFLNSLVVDIKSNVFVYMIKSWPVDQRFPQKFDNIERIKIQAGFNATLIETSARLHLIDRAYTMIGAYGEISNSKRLELACTKFPHMQYIFDLLKSVSNESRLTQLLNEQIFVNDPFSRIFSELNVLSSDSLLSDGILPDFNMHYTLNRIDREIITNAIHDRILVDNFSDFDGQRIVAVSYDDIARAFRTRYFKWMLFRSKDLYYNFKIMIPYQISHDFPSVDGKVLIEGVSIEGADLTLRKCLKISPLTVNLTAVDGRKYDVYDSYVQKPYVLECAFPPERYRGRIVVRREIFVANLFANSVLEKCIIGKNFSFTSSLSRELPK